MATKLQKMRQIIKQYGAEYGWEWAQKTGLLYAPSQHGLDYYDSWNLQQDITNGNENAKRVAQAITYIGRQELYEAQRTLKRRKSSPGPVEEMYKDKAIELIEKQRKRIAEAADLSSTILGYQNIYRESTPEASRQTPRVRASAKGVSARAERGREILEKALKSDAIYARASMVNEDVYNALERTLHVLGINLNDIAEKYKIQEGDPYKALEMAYIEATETATEQIEKMKENQEVFDEFVASKEAVELMNMLGVDYQ